MRNIGKKMKYSFIIISSVLFLSFLFSSCSKLNEPLPDSPDITTHKAGILNPGSPDFHGLLVAQSNNGWDVCQQCHASNFSGGITPVGCNVVKCHPAINVHQDGITDPASLEFHGKFIRANGWNLAQCSQCHSSDYAGGVASPSCLTCHTSENGPEACNTCHGDFDVPDRIAPPRDTKGNIETDSVGVGAHVSHLYDNELGHQIECSTCHIVPNKYSDPGHIDAGLPAEITFGNLAIHNIAVNPVYDYPTATCSEVYCHGEWAFLKDSSDYQYIYVDTVIVGNAFSPIWNKVDGTQALCGTCHNLPPVGHQNAGNDPNATTCGGCHIGIVDANGNIIDQTKHINGEKNVFGN